MLIPLLVSAFTWGSELTRLPVSRRDKTVKIALSQPSCKQVKNMKDDIICRTRQISETKIKL